eukprot:6187944-Pleurochrysis_carterae.AAC.1
MSLRLKSTSHLSDPTQLSNVLFKTEKIPCTPMLGQCSERITAPSPMPQQAAAGEHTHASGHAALACPPAQRHAD